MGPWDGLDKVSCYPICGCEALDVTALIAQPWASWSSFAYWIVAFYLVKKHGLKSELPRLWIFLLLFLGVSSFLCHSTWIRLAGAMDFTSITAILSFFIFFRIVRKKRFLFLLLYMVFLTTFFYFLSGWPRILLVLSIFIPSLWEVKNQFGWSIFKDQTILQILTLLFGSFAFFLLDEIKVYCFPEGVLHGHTLWHMGTAIAIARYGDWRVKKARMRPS